MSSVASARSAPVIFTTANGREVKFSGLKWDSVICKFEDWLRNRDLEAKIDGWDMLVKRGLMSPEKVLELTNEFSDEANDNGRYSFAGPVMGPIMGMVEAGRDDDEAKKPLYAAARLKMASLMCGISVDDLIPIASRQPKEFWAAVQMAFREVDAGVEETATAV